MKSIAGLIVSFLVCFAAAAAGAMATRSAPEFYATLDRPSWAPPAAVFGPVWTILYALMAVAAWLVWKEKGFSGAQSSLGLFLIQLIINALWSWIFFAWRRGVLAEVDVVALLVMIIGMVLAFWRVRPLAGALLIPYAAWVAYATALTFSLVRRNPAVL